MRHIEVFAREVMRARSRAVVGLVLAGLANAGCYTYAPISFEAVKPKDDVRVRVTDDAAARLVKDLGAFSTELDGEFSRQPHDSVSIGVAIDREYRGIAVGTTTQTLFLARSDILDLRQRQFSKGRTIFVSVGAVVGFAALAATIKQIVDPNGAPDNSTTNPPPPPQMRRPPRTQFGVRIPIP
jgi:hypothetical protein